MHILSFAMYVRTPSMLTAQLDSEPLWNENVMPGDIGNVTLHLGGDAGSR